MIIGITGSLGTGKTTVGKFFGRLGARVIDADKIARGLLDKDKNIKKRIVRYFGGGILTRGRIDRKKLARSAFGSKAGLKRLCSIVHPEVISVIRKRARAAGKKTVAVDAPLLIEAGLHRYADKVVVVVTNKARQMARCGQSGLSRKEAGKRIRNQMPLRKKMRLADFIIDNNGSLSNTRKQVLKIWKELQRR